MRRLALTAASVIVLFGWTVSCVEGAARRDAAAWPNFVANPGFEVVQGRSPAGWNVSGKQGFSLSGKAHSGQSCVALASPNGEWPAIEQEVKLPPGQDYALSFWFRSEGSGSGSLGVKLMATGWGADFRPPPSPEWKRCFFLIQPKVPTFKLHFTNYHHKGMTFFIDDVCIDTNLGAVVELLEPVADKGPSANNTPTFKWRPAMDKKFLSFDLLLSRSLKFPPRQTQVFSDLLEEVEYTPFEPLTNGKWFWKVRWHYNNLATNVTGQGESEPASLVVKTDGKDYRAPRITQFGPTRIEDPAAAEIRVKYEDNPLGSGIDRRRVALKIDGEDVTAQCKVTDEAIVYRPAKIDEAVHTGEVTVADREGNTTPKRWWFLVKPKPAEGIASWDKQKKVFLVDGKPLFPFGMYQYRYNNPYDAYRGWGFNTVHFYDGNLPLGVRAASKAGLRVFALSVINWGEREQASFMDDDAHGEDHPALPILAKRIFEVCNEPSLFCWSLCDEPDKRPMPRKRLKALHDFVKSLDPYHLTDVVLMTYGAYDAYAGVADLLVGDVYPYDQWHGGQNPAMIWDEPIHQDRAQGGDRPALTILQHHGGTPGTICPHVVPTTDRRSMAYLVYIHGTRGIMWFAYGCGSTKYRSEDYPEQWEYMKRLANEFETMSPVLLADDAPEKVLMRVTAPLDKQDRAGNPAVHYVMKAHGDKRYLIAVNAAKEPVQAAFRLGVPIASVKEIPGDRSLAVTGRLNFSDTFTAFGARVYEIELIGRSSAPARGRIGRGDVKDDVPRVSTPDPSEARPKPAAKVRTWKDGTGRFEVEAEFIECREGTVRLRKTDGAVIAVSVDRLSEPDRQYVRSLSSGEPAK